MNVFAATLFKAPKISVWFAALLILFASCSVVKDYPAQTPFVYKTNIEIKANLKPEERKGLASQLQDQLHDSIRVRWVSKFIGWDKGPRILYSELRKPAVFDTNYASQSMTFMRALLHAQGYYRDSINFQTRIDSLGDELRTHINFNVHPGKIFLLDSVAYNIKNDSLQRVTQSAKGQSLLKKGSPFSKALISSERDRLTDVYRNNGYLRFSQEELLVVWDTLGRALLRPTLDPAEQAAQLEALQRRRENPTADIEFVLRDNPDTTHLIKYYIGNVIIYPDLNQDTAAYQPIVRKRGEYTIISYRDLYRPSVVVENIYLRRGEVYSQRNYLRTLNRFNSIGSWRLVSIDQIPRGNTDTVDFVVKLTPAPKYGFDANLESSQNWGSPFTEGVLVGVNFGLQNRNFSRGANLANTTFRFGTDLNPSRFVQTKQISLGHVINFPRMLPRFNYPAWLKENARTSLAFNASLINRDTFFNLINVNASWGYDINWKNKLLSVRIPNVEYSGLKVFKGLQRLIDSNGSFRFIFNNGLVISSIASLTTTHANSRVTTFSRINTEISGLVAGLIKNSFLDNNLYRFIKLDGDFRQTYNLRTSRGRNNHFAWRAFGGIGYEIINPRNPNKKYLPFFKAYFAGGPNSMRAWQLRRLGPGSSKKSFEQTVAPERFGDIQLELNAEYRFFLADISGVVINSVFFTDIGNIWFLRENPDFDNGHFELNRLGKDLAIGAGTGLRVDFGPFLLRVDYGYRVKNPNATTQWFASKRLKNGQLQLGVTYPF